MFETVFKEIINSVAVEVEDEPEVKEPELPIIPNYLSNPAFMYSKMDKSEIMRARHLAQNSSGEDAEDTPSDSPSLSPSHELPKPQSRFPDGPSPPPSAPTHSQAHGDFIPVTEQNGASHSPASSRRHAAANCAVPMDLVNHGDYPPAGAHNGTACSPPSASPSPSVASSSGGHVQAPVGGANPTVGRQQSLPQQLNYGQAGGPVAAFQPFFFTSTFPVNVQGGGVLPCVL